MKKYNITINTMFWILVASVISIISFSLVFPEGSINFLLFKEKEKVIIKKEEVVVKEEVVIKEKEEWFYFVATGYSANDPSQGTTDTTATGKEVYEGMIAVDPKIIPLGTKIEIRGMGIFVADDTGGKIKGNRIDIFFESKEEAKKFGKKNVWVRIIDDDSNIKLAQIFR